MFMGVLKSPWGVDGSLVGVEDYLGPLLLFFACQSVKFVQAMVVRFVVSGNRWNTVGDDLIVEGIEQQCPFPLLTVVLQYCHIGYYNLKRRLCIPTTFDKIFVFDTFFSGRFIPAFSRFRTDSGSFTAFMRQIVWEYSDNPYYLCCISNPPDPFGPTCGQIKSSKPLELSLLFHVVGIWS